MEPAALAASVVAVLAPYLAKAGEEFAKEAGKAAADKIGALYQAIKARFQRHPAATESLSDLEKAPDDEDARAVLRVQLKKQLAADPAFATELQQLVQAIGQDQPATTFLTQVYGGEVGQILNINQGDQVDAHLTIQRKG
jgi:hypothetical protein